MRFDLSKGFTQVNNINDVGAWSRRDDSRIAILKEMTDKIWAKHPDTYIILEHFADNEEETILANYTNADQTNSIMLWGNMHGSFETNIKGNNGANIDWASHTTRGWNQPGVVAFMESHDEERQMYAALNGGSPVGGANTVPVATRRIAAANALLYTIPGPKMLWQFGELGYDYSINYCINTGTNGDCRIDRKPIRWDYTEDADRWSLYQMTSEIIKLRTKYEVFQTATVTIGGENNLAKYVKLINKNFVESPTTPEQMNVITVANLDVTSRQIVPKFPHTGTWYNYLTEETLNVTNENQSITLSAGSFGIYTDVNLNEPIVSSAADELLRASISLFPNPAQDQLQVSLENEVKGSVELRVVDLLGKEITSVKAQKKVAQLSQSIDIAHLPSGMYILQIITSEGKAGKPFFKQ